MHNQISAKGYSSLVMVLNMKRFIHKDSQRYFETIRGTQEFARVLRNDWQVAGNRQKVFLPPNAYSPPFDSPESTPDIMSPEQVGFATGIFRSIMLEHHTFPTFMLDKEQVTFPESLCDNFQFKTLFLRAWERWDVLIRPSHTGFFIILTHVYRQQARPLYQLAQDVLNLQESLDVPSAQKWLLRNRTRGENQPAMPAEREQSATAFLKWVGADENGTGELHYLPVQWKLAMEVASLFIPTLGAKSLFLEKRRSY